MPEKATSGAVAAVAYTNSCHPQKRDCRVTKGALLPCYYAGLSEELISVLPDKLVPAARKAHRWSWWETTRTSSSVRKACIFTTVQYSTYQSSFIPSQED